MYLKKRTYQDYKGGQYKFTNQDKVNNAHKGAYLENNFVNTAPRYHNQRLLDNVVPGDLVQGVKPLNDWHFKKPSATLHSMVVPHLQLSVILPANINSMTETFLAFIHTNQFNLQQFTNTITGQLHREKVAASTSPCHLIMYCHLVHSILYRTGVPNTIGQSVELDYITRERIYNKDDQDRYTPEKYTPAKIMRADTFIQIIVTRFDAIADCNKKAALQTQGKTDDDLLVTWKPKSDNPEFGAYSYWSKTQDLEKTKYDAVMLFQQFQQAAVARYRFLIGFNQKTGLSDEHLPIKESSLGKIEYNPEFLGILNNIDAETFRKDELPDVRKGGVYFVEGPTKVDIKVLGSDIISLYRYHDQEAYIRPKALKYIDKIGHNYLCRWAKHFENQQSQFDAESLNLAINCNILQQQLEVNFDQDLLSYLNEKDAMVLSVRFNSFYDQDIDVIENAVAINQQRMIEFGPRVRRIRPLSEISSQAPGVNRSLKILSEQTPSVSSVQDTNQIRQDNPPRVKVQYNFVLFNKKQILDQIEKDVLKERRDEVYHETQWAQKIVEMTTKFEQLFNETVKDNVMARVESDTMMFVPLFSRQFQYLQDMHIEVPVGQIQKLKDILNRFDTKMRQCRQAAYSLTPNSGYLFQLLQITDEIENFLRHNCELTELFRQPGRDHYDMMIDGGLSDANYSESPSQQLQRRQRLEQQPALVIEPVQPAQQNLNLLNRVDQLIEKQSSFGTNTLLNAVNEDQESSKYSFDVASNVFSQIMKERQIQMRQECLKVKSELSWELQDQMFKEIQRKYGFISEETQKSQIQEAPVQQSPSEKNSVNQSDLLKLSCNNTYSGID